MIQLKDVIHYYIGQRCVCSWFPKSHFQHDRDWVLAAVEVDTSRSYKLVNRTDLIWSEEVKPILRKLEDISEEEAKYIINNYSFRSVDMPLNQKKFAIEIAKRLTEQLGVAHYLLKQGFDLFGLIESGQAVDSKTLNQKV